MAILAQLVDDVVVHKFELAQARTNVGRLMDNDIAIDDSAISSLHAIIHRLENKDFPEYIEYYIDDNGSTNGTFVNEIQVQGRERLHHNDQIRLAWNMFKFIDPNEIDLTKTTHLLEK